MGGSGTRVGEVGRLLSAGAVSLLFSDEAGADRDLAFSMSLSALLRPVRLSFFICFSPSSSALLFKEDDLG